MVTGVVLKNYYPHRSKVALLSSTGERLDLSVSKSSLIARIHAGYRINCQLESVGGLPRVVHLDLLGTPVALSWQSLIFLQKILKLCFLGVVPGASCLAAIQLLDLILQTPQLSLSSGRQRLLICHLLSAWGLIPELSTFGERQIRCMYQIGQMSLGDLQALQINEAMELFLMNWIDHFVQEQASNYKSHGDDLIGVLDLIEAVAS